jgi:hypothetical protein
MYTGTICNSLCSAASLATAAAYAPQSANLAKQTWDKMLSKKVRGLFFVCC